ncbi:Putative ribonuclease H protein [Dendrobium catenatum]|uniref:Ribonuclease H protein n=1 Tax=Dendrobium catenatum TaxID=906689 RepID=A0A2I0WFS6_9ASPA|nr:Putative ribonuclease H protein [Dendrobium catenatum]
MIFKNSLMDLNSVGSKYTWFNQRVDNPIHIKLDRVLVNNCWMNAFTDSFYSIQSPACSDHCPIILHSGIVNQVRHRFLFKNYWAKLDRYWTLLLQVFSENVTGNPLSHLCNTLRQLKSLIKKELWSNSNSIARHLNSLLRLQGEILEKLHEEPNSPTLNIALKDTNAKIAEFNAITASWIIQRAKVNWLKHGEEDLKFLYGKIRCRRSSSKSVINLIASTPSNNRDTVVSTILKHFQELYNPPPSQNHSLDSLPIGYTIPETCHHALTSYIQEEEIKKAVFQGNSTSAPGAIRSFFFKGYIPNGVKATALAIIPKHKNATSIADYRPIALCNVLYKIIAKVISNRLKPIMPSIIESNQSGFIKSRISTDNILLASDILASAGKRGGANFFCAKLDIKKAFDTVSRGFILDRMVKKGFPNVFVNWIKMCITDVNFSIVLNGALEGYFNTSAGLRQGCPLSPYLFCLAMDALSNLLDGRDFKGISVKNFSLTHLLYADDVLIFGEASFENCHKLANILSEFANVTGLKINFEKSAIMFPKLFRYQQEICQILSIHNISSKISYLGIPITFQRLKIEDYLPFMDSINKKMNGWKANLLSFGGRLQYLKFTIQNSIGYWIRGSILPKTVIKFLKKSSSRFLFFGDCSTSRKLHMISWDVICRPKHRGGLGIPTVNALQFANNCSVIFRMYNCITPLSSWLINKYMSPWRPPPCNASKF